MPILVSPRNFIGNPGKSETRDKPEIVEKVVYRPWRNTEAAGSFEE
jgi:hypothetical protein